MSKSETCLVREERRKNVETKKLAANVLPGVGGGSKLGTKNIRWTPMVTLSPQSCGKLNRHTTTQPELNGCWKWTTKLPIFCLLLSCNFGEKMFQGKEWKLLERGFSSDETKFIGKNGTTLKKKVEFSHIFVIFFENVCVRWTKLCCRWVIEWFESEISWCEEALRFFAFVRLVGYFICLPRFGCAWTRRAGSWSTPFYWFCRRG